MFTPMEVETSESKYFNEESSEYDRIVKLIQSNRADAADLIFEELKKSIKRKGRWIHDDRVWPHENGKSEKGEKNKRKLKIVDNQELYTRFVPAANSDEIKSPVKEPKREKFDEVFDLTKDDSNEKPENKRLTVSNKNEVKKEEVKEPSSKKIKTESTVKSKDEISVKSEKSSSKSGDESNGKNSDKFPATSLVDDVELLLSLSNGDQEEVEPKMLRKRKEVKKENSSIHRISNGGVQKKKAGSAAGNQAKSGKGGDALFNLKENMKTQDDALDSNKVRQKMFYGSTQVTRRDKPRREGTLADDSKKRLEAKLKKVKAKLKKSI